MKQFDDFARLYIAEILSVVFCGSPIGQTDITMHRECFPAIQSQPNNNDILITTADKSSQVVFSINLIT